MSAATPTLLQALQIETEGDLVLLTVETVEGTFPFALTVEQTLLVNAHLGTAIKDAIHFRKSQILQRNP